MQWYTCEQRSLSLTIILQHPDVVHFTVFWNFYWKLFLLMCFMMDCFLNESSHPQSAENIIYTPEMTPSCCLQCPSQNPRGISFTDVKQKRATNPLIQNVVSVKYLAFLQLLPQPLPIDSCQLIDTAVRVCCGLFWSSFWSQNWLYLDLHDYIVLHLFESPKTWCGRKPPP